MATRKTNDGMEIIKRRFGIDPSTDPNVQAFAEDFRVAQMVYDARQAAGMTQKELAEAIGAAESVVAELEDADFEGDSLSMLRRIADALHMKLRIELVPAES
ncbi:MAG: helix-turn-helix transcriptional regulator [Pirellulales bacterium]